MTKALILQMLTLFFLSPASDATVGRALHALFGQPNLDEWLGHCCALGAASAIFLHVKTRLDITQDQLVAWFNRSVAQPMTIVAPVLLALFVKSPSLDTHWPDAQDAPTDIWLDLYWTLLCAFTGYMCVGAIRALLALREYPENNTTANIYIAGCAGALAACIGHIISTWLDVNYKLWLHGIGGCVAIAFAYGSTRAWRQKIRRLQPPKVRL